MQSTQEGACSSWELVATFSGWHRISEQALKTTCSTTLNRFWILLLLETNGDMNVRRMADTLELKYTTVAECTAALERLGAVSKRSEEDDRRTAVASITPAGRKLFYAWDACLVGVVQRAWQAFDRETRAHAFYLFHLVTNFMGKTRMMDDLVRGDSSFIVTCSQVSMDFQELCRTLLLSPAQALSLLVLLDTEGAKQKDLANLLAEHPCDMSKTLAKLRKQGYVELGPGASKREVSVHLTERGRERAGMLQTESEALLARRLNLPDADAAFLRGVCKRLLEELRAVRLR